MTYFFSYARSDSEFALRLAKDLRSAGVQLWLDQLDIVGGQQWDRAVEEALHRCGGMIVVLTPEAVRSRNVMDEVSFALEEEKLVVPIMLRSCQIPFRLRRVHRVNFTMSYDDAVRELRRALQRPSDAEQSRFSESEENDFSHTDEPRRARQWVDRNVGGLETFNERAMTGRVAASTGHASNLQAERGGARTQPDPSMIGAPRIDKAGAVFALAVFVGAALAAVTESWLVWVLAIALGAVLSWRSMKSK
jgi:hypothetical protein